jgi:uncharacterized protein (TIRG00374 family)
MEEEYGAAGTSDTRSAEADQAAPPAPAAGPRWSWRYLLTLILLGLAVHLLLPQLTTLSHSLAVVRQMKWWILALAAVAQFCSYLGSGVLLCGISAMGGARLSVARGTLITTAANSFGLLVGGMVGAGAVTYRWLRSRGVDEEESILAGWLPGFLYDIPLVVLSILGLLYLLLVHKLTRSQIFTFTVILAFLLLLGGLFAWAARARDAVLRMMLSSGRLLARLRRRDFKAQGSIALHTRLFRAWDALIAGGWRIPVAGAFLNAGFDLLTLYLVFRAAGYPIGPGILLAGYGLPLLIGKLPLLPGGLGLVEGSMAAFYTGLGVPDAMAVVVILGYRLLSFWFPTFLGFVFVPYLQKFTRGDGLPTEGS